jgi:hypothetical protein
VIAESLPQAWGLGKPLPSKEQPSSPAPSGAQARPTSSAFGFRNGSMTAGDAVPEGWVLGDGKGRIARDLTTFKTGPASLRVEPVNGVGLAMQDLKGAAGSQITVTGHVRSTGAAKVQAALQPHNANWSQSEWQTLVYVQGTTDWTAFHKTVTVPAWATNVRLQLLVEGEGSGWIDEASVLGPAAE